MLTQALEYQQDTLRQLPRPTLFWDKLNQTYNQYLFDKISDLQKKQSLVYEIGLFLRSHCQLINGTTFSPLSRAMSSDSRNLFTMVEYYGASLGIAPVSLLFPDCQNPEIAELFPSLMKLCSQSIWDPLSKKLLPLTGCQHLDINQPLEHLFNQYLPDHQNAHSNLRAFKAHSYLTEEIYLIHRAYHSTDATHLLSVLEFGLELLAIPLSECLGPKNQTCLFYFDSMMGVVVFYESLSEADRLTLDNTLKTDLEKFFQDFTLNTSLSADLIKRKHHELHHLLQHSDIQLSLQKVGLNLAEFRQEQLQHRFDFLKKVLVESDYSGSQKFGVSSTLLKELDLEWEFQNPRDLEVLFSLSPESFLLFFSGTPAAINRFEKVLFFLQSRSDLLILFQKFSLEQLQAFWGIFGSNISKSFFPNLSSLAFFLTAFPSDLKFHEKLLGLLKPELSDIIGENESLSPLSSLPSNTRKIIIQTLAAEAKNPFKARVFLRCFLHWYTSQESSTCEGMQTYMSSEQWRRVLSLHIKALDPICNILPPERSRLIRTECFNQDVRIIVRHIGSLEELCVWFAHSYKPFPEKFEQLKKLTYDNHFALLQRLLSNDLNKRLTSDKVSHSFFRCLHWILTGNKNIWDMLREFFQQPTLIKYICQNQGQLKCFLEFLSQNHPETYQPMLSLFADNDFQMFKKTQFCSTNTLYFLSHSSDEQHQRLIQILLEHHLPCTEGSCQGVDGIISKLNVLKSLMLDGHITQLKFESIINQTCGINSAAIASILLKEHREEFCSRFIQWYRFWRSSGRHNSQPFIQDLGLIDFAFPLDLPSWEKFSDLLFSLWEANIHDYKSLLIQIHAQHQFKLFHRLIPSAQILLDFLDHQPQHKPKIYGQLLSSYFKTLASRQRLQEIISTTFELEKIAAQISCPKQKQILFKIYSDNHCLCLISLWRQSFDEGRKLDRDAFSPVFEAFSEHEQVIKILNDIYHFWPEFITAMSLSLKESLCAALLEPAHLYELKFVLEKDLQYGLSLSEKLFAFQHIAFTVTNLFSLMSRDEDKWAILIRLSVINNPHFESREQFKTLPSPIRHQILLLIWKYQPLEIMHHTIKIGDLQNLMKQLTDSEKLHLQDIIASQISLLEPLLESWHDKQIALLVWPPYTHGQIECMFSKKHPNQNNMLIYSNTGMPSNSSSSSTLDEIRRSLICINPLTNKLSLNINAMRNLVNNGTSYERIIQALKLSEENRVGFCAYIFKKYGCMRDFIPHVLNTPERVLLFFKVDPTLSYRNELINMLCSNNFSWLSKLCQKHQDLESLRECFCHKQELWVTAFNTLYPDQTAPTVTHNNQQAPIIPVGELSWGVSTPSSLLAEEKFNQTVDHFWNTGLCSTDKKGPFAFMSDEDLFISAPQTSALSATESYENPQHNKRSSPEEPEQNSSSTKSRKKKKKAPNN